MLLNCSFDVGRASKVGVDQLRTADQLGGDDEEVGRAYADAQGSL